MSLLPSAQALLIAAYRATTVAPMVGNRISTRLSGTYPAIRVTLLGGPDRPVDNTGQPEFQVECWGNGVGPAEEIEASDIARAVDAAVDDLPGTYTAGRIVAAYRIGGIIHSPDPSTSRQRYIVQVGLVTQ
jgi:hypothetical protein